MPRKSRLRAILLDMLTRHLETGEPIADGFMEGGVLWRTTFTNGCSCGSHLVEITACRDGERIPDAWITIEVDENLPE